MSNRKMNFAPKCTKICPSISPAKKYGLGYDAVVRVVVNGGGGMGGSRIEYYGTIIEKGTDGFLKLSLPHSDRCITINSRYVSEIENVKLWKETQHHENENIISPQVTFFCTHLDEELEFSDKPRTPGHIIAENHFETIDPDRC